MQRAAGPISPLSSPGANSDFASRYDSLGSAAPSSNGYGSAGPYGGVARPPPSSNNNNNNSPPSSGHPSSGTDASRPSGSSRGTSMNRPPSSASSVAVSDGGRPPFSKPSRNRDSTKSNFRPENEDNLARHYHTLKRYLASHLHDEQGNVKPNRARDKLLRLSETQFVELSTDVFDELVRREDDRLQRVRNVPRFLLPKNNFHPKRNQARQKLSTLPVERFRQLATDVFFELERRVPRFTGGEMPPRPMSAASNRSNRAPSRGGMRPPPPGYPRGPPPPGGRGMPPPEGPYGPYPGGPRSRGPSNASTLGRPLPKNLQSNTIVPNKSTMVEDDDSDPEGTYGQHQTSAVDRERLKAQESEITELKEKLEDLEMRLGGGSMAEQEREELEQKISDAEGQNYALRQELELKVKDVEKLNDDLRAELNRLQTSRSHEQDDLRSQNEDVHIQLRNFQAENEELRSQLDSHVSNEGYEKRIKILEDELSQQQKLTNEVRSEATSYIQEMRQLSRENDQAVEQEEKLATQVKKLESDVDAWRQRYAKVKAQNKHLRASTLGLGGAAAAGFDAGSLARKEGLMSASGVVKDVDVTRFQVSVDELLQVARLADTDAMLESVKQVVMAVQGITSAVAASGTDGYPTPSPSPLSPNKGAGAGAAAAAAGGAKGQARNEASVAKLRARVTGTANSLITATKQHASASGLSPVALLDAAASNLTSSVVELVKTVGIKPSSKSELEDTLHTSGIDEESENYQHLHLTGGYYGQDPSATTAGAGKGDTDLDSFYDSKSSGGEDEGFDRSTGQQQQQQQQEEKVASPSSTRPPALNITRSNTNSKKNNGGGGWFRWPGRRGDEDGEEEPPTPIAQTPITPAPPQVYQSHGGYGQGPEKALPPRPTYDGEEFDPYR